MKRRRNSNGQFRADRRITFLKLPKVIQTLTDLITCSYWFKAYPTMLLLRTLNYIDDVGRAVSHEGGLRVLKGGY
jgi:hypothetical protein